MLVMFFFFFISPRVLRGLSTDRPETWPHGRKLSEFYNPSPKNQGALPPKNLGPKTCKISVDFIQPPTLLPREATRSAVLPRQVICPSVCPSVTLRYRDHIGCNSAKIISRLISLTISLSAGS